MHSLHARQAIEPSIASCALLTVLTCLMHLCMPGWQQVGWWGRHNNTRVSARRSPTPSKSTPMLLLPALSMLHTSSGGSFDAIGCLCARHLQTNKGELAKRQTALEFYQDMGDVYGPWIAQIVKDHPEHFPNGIEDVLLLMDNSPQHKAAEAMEVFDNMHMLASQRLPHPPYSHEFQNPIEWAFGTLKADLRRALYSHPEVKTRDEIWALVQRLWRERFTPAVVLRSFKKQKHTLTDIIQAGGGRARAKYN